MVNFGNQSNFEIFVGQPFMHQLRLIQNWGYNYIYLCHAHAITQEDLKDHSYKDVINTPIWDMVSTIANEDSIPSWLI